MYKLITIYNLDIFIQKKNESDDYDNNNNSKH